MKGTGAKLNVCPGSCVSTGAKFPVAPVESAPMAQSIRENWYFYMKRVNPLLKVVVSGDSHHVHFQKWW